jgi:hypothetical protein
MINNMEKYVNGMFMKRKNGKYGEYFVISVKEEAFESLRNIEANSDGFRTIIASPKKDDNDKFSLKPFVKDKF